MNLKPRAGPPRTRRYESALRAAHVDQTRARIIDGVLEALKGGLAQLSVPAVARACRVSVPTIYRHFPSKQRLFDAVASRVGERTGMLDIGMPQDAGALVAWVEPAFAQLEATERLEPALATALAGAVGSELRREALVPPRRRVFEAAVAQVTRGWPARERRLLVDATIVLASSATMRAYRDYLGASPSEAARGVQWVLRRVMGIDGGPPAAKGEQRWKRNGRGTRKRAARR